MLNKNQDIYNLYQSLFKYTYLERQWLQKAEMTKKKSNSNFIRYKSSAISTNPPPTHSGNRIFRYELINHYPTRIPSRFLLKLILYAKTPEISHAESWIEPPSPTPPKLKNGKDKKERIEEEKNSPSIFPPRDSDFVRKTRYREERSERKEQKTKKKNQRKRCKRTKKYYWSLSVLCLSPVPISKHSELFQGRFGWDRVQETFALSLSPHY